MSESPDCHRKALQRYSRQMILPEVGIQGQRILSNSRVIVVGAGGIGSTVIPYLAAAGISVDVADFDIVEVSNLHRQIIHSDFHEGMGKAESAAKRIQQLNPHVGCKGLNVQLSADNALETIAGYDLVIDATDNYEVRYALNDACVLLKKTLVSGSAIGFEGQITVFEPYITPCYRCLYPKPPVSCGSCSSAGVLGPVPGLIGCLEAIEAMKVLLLQSRGDSKNTTKQWCESQESETEQVVGSESGIFSTEIYAAHSRQQQSLASRHSAHSSAFDNLETLNGKQLLYDGAIGAFHTFTLPPRRDSCAVCGNSPTILSMQDSKIALQEALDRIETEKAAQSQPAHKTLPLDASAEISGITYLGILQESTISSNRDRCLEDCSSVAVFGGDHPAISSSSSSSSPNFRGVHLIIDVRSDVQFGMTSLLYSPLVAKHLIFFDSTKTCLRALKSSDRTCDYNDGSVESNHKPTSGSCIEGSPGTPSVELKISSKLQASGIIERSRCFKAVLLHIPLDTLLKGHVTAESAVQVGPKPATKGTCDKSNGETTGQWDSKSSGQFKGSAAVSKAASASATTCLLDDLCAIRQHLSTLQQVVPPPPPPRDIKDPQSSPPSPQSARLSELRGSAIREDQDCVPSIPIFTLCRRGIDSLEAVQYLRHYGFGSEVRSIQGGLTAWARNVEDDFPMYS